MLEESYILSRLPTEIDEEFAPLKVKAGIFTNNRLKVKKVLDQVYNDNKDNVVCYANGKDNKYILLKDGTWYIWIKLNLSRGHRCRKVYIDKDIDIDTLHNLVMPRCIYCTRNNVVVI